MAYVNVKEWSVDQVTDWLKGLDNVISHRYAAGFLNNAVTGSKLLRLRPDDLDNLGMKKLGHQEILLEAVEHLTNFHYELDKENLQSLALKLSCAANALYNELSPSEDESAVVGTQVMADVSNVIAVLKPLAAWLDRSPFSSSPDGVFVETKTVLLEAALEMATSAHRGIFSEKPLRTVRTICRKLTKIADRIVQEMSDPLILQPASLDLATVKKRGDRHHDVGFFVAPSSPHPGHRIAFERAAAAALSSKIEEGDEIVQVNYQTVVGWQRKKVQMLLEGAAGGGELLLTLKKRPRHTNVYGQIYVKPYRLPSRKRNGGGGGGGGSWRWENLPPSPRLLPIVDLPRIGPVKLDVSPNVVDEQEEEEEEEESSDDDDDDAAAVDEPAAALARIYPLKPRPILQRRNTISGSTPTNKRPYPSIEQYWNYVKSRPDVSTRFDSTFLRDKSASCTIVDATAPPPRPTTVIGLQQQQQQQQQHGNNINNNNNNNSSSTNRINNNNNNNNNNNKRVNFKEVKEEEEEKREKENLLTEGGGEKSVSLTSLAGFLNNETISFIDEGRELTDRTSMMTIDYWKKEIVDEIIDSIKNKKSSIPKEEETAAAATAKRESINISTEENKSIIEEETASTAKRESINISMEENKSIIEEETASTAKRESIKISMEENKSIIEEETVATSKQESINRKEESINRPMNKDPILSDIKIDRIIKKFDERKKSSPEVPPKPENKKKKTKPAVPPRSAATKLRGKIELNRMICENSNRFVEENEEKRADLNRFLEEKENSVKDDRKGVLEFQREGEMEEKKNENRQFSYQKSRSQPPQRPLLAKFPEENPQFFQHERISRHPSPHPHPHHHHLRPEFPEEKRQQQQQHQLSPSRSPQHLRLPEFSVKNEEKPRQHQFSEEKRHPHPAPPKQRDIDSPIFGENPPKPPPRNNSAESGGKKTGKSGKSESEGGGFYCRGGTMARRSASETKLSPTNSIVKGLMAAKKGTKKKNSLAAKRRQVSVADLAPSDMEGPLFQRLRGGRHNQNNAHWERRWFVLAGGSMYGFKDERAPSAACLIFLSGFTVAPASEVKSRPNSFKVYHTGTVFYFAAEDADVATSWIDAARAATLRHEAAKPPPPETGSYSETDDESDSEGSKRRRGGGEGRGADSKCGSLRKSKKGAALEGGSTSLDRKWFFNKAGGPRKEAVPVPTAHFRSYRKIRGAVESSVTTGNFTSHVRLFGAPGFSPKNCSVPNLAMDETSSAVIRPQKNRASSKYAHAHSSHDDVSRGAAALHHHHHSPLAGLVTLEELMNRQTGERGAPGGAASWNLRRVEPDVVYGEVPIRPKIPRNSEEFAAPNRRSLSDEKGGGGGGGSGGGSSSSCFGKRLGSLKKHHKKEEEEEEEKVGDGEFEGKISTYPKICKNLEQKSNRSLPRTHRYESPPHQLYDKRYLTEKYEKLSYPPERVPPPASFPLLSSTAEERGGPKSGGGKLRHIFGGGGGGGPKKERTFLGSPKLHRAIFRRRGSGEEEEREEKWEKEIRATTHSISAQEAAAAAETPPPPLPADFYPHLEYPPVFEPETYSFSNPRLEKEEEEEEEEKEGEEGKRRMRRRERSETTSRVRGRLQEKFLDCDF